MPVEETLAAADRLVESGELREARRRLRDLVRSVPHRLDVREHLADVYRREGHPEQAGRWAYLSETVDPAELAAFRRAFGDDPVQMMAALAWTGSEANAPTEVARERLSAVRRDAEAAARRRLTWERPTARSRGTRAREAAGNAAMLALVVLVLVCLGVGAFTIVHWFVGILADWPWFVRLVSG
ncbi:hypothetical protein ICW40_07065 [Actinotalea ferrariae]|uniref:DUF6584 family protein n=1 Tax=Actinotalea ferrariae TaxID=1386098 RepID=UPI001C8BFCEC|nr:DUF6584 family protein [Actinotalea ferrariae]MBX9244567.1 hypothetical protein [Actinotalea ferrariae]